MSLITFLGKNMHQLFFQYRSIRYVVLPGHLPYNVKINSPTLTSIHFIANIMLTPHSCLSCGHPQTSRLQLYASGLSGPTAKQENLQWSSPTLQHTQPTVTNTLNKYRGLNTLHPAATPVWLLHALKCALLWSALQTPWSCDHTSHTKQMPICSVPGIVGLQKLMLWLDLKPNKNMKKGGKKHSIVIDLIAIKAHAHSILRLDLDVIPD